jgi:hypothetical protein
MTDAQNEAKGLRKTAASYIMNNQIDRFISFLSLLPSYHRI